MDSEHRHELKRNELAEGLTHPSEFLHKHKSTFMLILIVLLALVAVYLYKFSSSIAQQSKMSKKAEATMLIQKASDARINSIQPSPNGQSLQAMAYQLDEASKNYDGNIAAMLLIQKGNALRADIHYTSAGMSQATIQSHIEDARKAYQEAISKAAGSVNENQLIANAKIGLGLCHEELGEYEDASKIYKEIATDEKLKGTVFAMKAQMRLDGLSDNQGTFIFVEAPEPVEAEEAVRSAPLPVNPEAMLQDVLKNAPKEDDKTESEEPK